MRPAKPTRRLKAESTQISPFRLRQPDLAASGPEEHVHKYGKCAICATDTRGQPMPRSASPLELVVNATDGFIPLWAKDVTLRWRFQEHSLTVFEDASAAKAAIEKLLGEALLAWGDAVPVRFAKRNEAWDFEISVKKSDECNTSGCVLASAFFPDAGRHELNIFPKMFEQDHQEQVDTLAHELGHTFGLRHFFAQISETKWRSEIFGKHNPFSIMNYGNQSTLTKDDKSDLKLLYQKAWSGELTQINGTPIRLVKPFSVS